MQSVLKTISKYRMFHKNDVIGVACSGGVDSICLLHYLNSIKDKFNIDVVAININHSIRENSAEDTKFVEDFCKEHKIRLYKFKVDCLKIAQEKKLSIEEAARVARYGMFDSLMSKGIVDKICLGHHFQDQAETVLLNLFRGCGLSGASGMEYVRDNYLRPMLDATKLEIETYARENALSYVEDESNFDETYSRNFLRNNIMPKLRAKWNNLDKNLVDFAKICKEDDEYIRTTYMLDGIIEEQNLIRIPLSYFLYPNAVINRVIFEAFEYLKVNKDIEKKHIKIIKDMANQAQNGVKISLPNKVIVHKEYDFISISVKVEKPKQEEIKFRLGSFNLVNFGNLTVRKSGKYEFLNNNHIIDSDKLPEGCVIRTRKAGDVFAKFGSGSKKLNDYFIDIKVPQRLRSEIPLICKDNVVYCVLGYEISDLVKTDASTKSAYILTYKKD